MSTKDLLLVASADGLPHPEEIERSPHQKPLAGFVLRSAILAGLVITTGIVADVLTPTFNDPISIVADQGGVSTCCPVQ